VEVTLAALSDDEWESLCDGCGRCCMCKFEDQDSGEMLYTDVACPLFNAESCRCSDYETRHLNIPNCLNIRQFTPDQFHWLPSTCAYRLCHEGNPLPAWHPWRSGDARSVAAAGISMQGKVFASSETMDEEAITARIIDPTVNVT